MPPVNQGVVNTVLCGHGGRMADDDGRNETKAERLDRNWNDMLQELRVVQTGVQLLSGFLLTLPFTERFRDLDVWQERLYLALVLTAALAVGATLTPIMVHRRLFGQQVKERVVGAGHMFLQVVMGLLALIIVGISTLIFSVVLQWEAALVVTVVSGAVLVLLLLVVPLLIRRRNASP
jgi:hypothetical protein